MEMKENIIEEAPYCFACGKNNPIGLKIDFTLDSGIVTGTFVPGEFHVGYQNTIHGGILFAALDDVMANVLYLQNIKAHTAKCEVRYRLPLKVGEEVNLKGWIEFQKKRLYMMKGEIRKVESQELVAESEASFISF